MNLEAHHTKLLNMKDVEPKKEAIIEAVAKVVIGITQIPLSQILAEVEVFCIQEALELSDNNVAAAARILGINRTNLVWKMSKMRLRAKKCV